MAQAKTRTGWLLVDIDYRIDHKLVLAACVLLLELFVLYRLTH